MTSNLTWNTNTSLISVQRGDASVFQKRLILIIRPHVQARKATDPNSQGHFHQTRSSRMIRILKIGGVLGACFIGAVVIFHIARVVRGGTIPPHTWARTADQQTREGVEAALAVNFDIARNSAPHQRNDALREATFRVPHELASLNKDAPDFRLEDLGPMVHGKMWGDRFGERFPSLAPFFVDCAEETRVFLYFPNGATKATAVFVAVNAELGYPLHNPQCSAGSVDAVTPTSVYRPSVEVALLTCAWEFQHEVWALIHPARVVDQIDEMERLPVIFNFREKAFGALYYKRLGMILDRSMCVTPLVIKKLDKEIMQQ